MQLYSRKGAQATQHLVQVAVWRSNEQCSPSRHQCCSTDSFAWGVKPRRALISTLHRSCAQLRLAGPAPDSQLMEGRPAKIARLQSLRARLPYVSQAALSAILQVAATEPLPTGSTRADVRQARDIVPRLATPYGPLHQSVHMPGGATLEIQHPFAMLYYACAHSTGFSSLVARAHAASPSTWQQPWKLILYADEIQPGNQLSYNNKRKLWGLYWSCLDWGSAALADEEIRQCNTLRCNARLTMLYCVIQKYR